MIEVYNKFAELKLLDDERAICIAHRKQKNFFKNSNREFNHETYRQGNRTVVTTIAVPITINKIGIELTTTMTRTQEIILTVIVSFALMQLVISLKSTTSLELLTKQTIQVDLAIIKITLILD